MSERGERPWGKTKGQHRYARRQQSLRSTIHRFRHRGQGALQL